MFLLIYHKGDKQMKIIYVHHGHRLRGNPPGPNDDLTEIGYRDCETVSMLLDVLPSKDKIVAIYSSPYFRCKKTAELINKNLNLDIIMDDRLNEYNFSTETWVDAQTRITKCIDDIIQNHNDEEYVICVTSGINIGPFITKAYGLPITETNPHFGVPSCSPIIFEYKK